MDNMDAVQQNHRSIRPMIDPHQQQQQQQQQGAWYSGQQQQFQYQQQQQQQQQWHAPPVDPQYAPQAFNPQQGQHYPLPPPPPQRPMPPHQVTHMYAQPDQAWTNPGWSHQQSWEFTGNNTGVIKEDDWAAKARAWAAAKAAMEAQQAQSQFATVNRPAEHHQLYQGHYSQPVQSQFAEAPQPSFPALGQQSVQPPPISVPNITTNQVQDSSSHFPNDVSSSYASDVFISYGSKDAVATHEQNASGISSQESIPTTTASYSQEMPLSYTSVPGFEEQAKLMQTSNSQVSSPMALQQDEHMLQAQLHSTSISQLPSQSAQQPHFTYPDQQVPHVPEVSHQQPDFEHDAQDYHQHHQSSYLQPVQTMTVDGQDYNGPPPSVSGWSHLGGSNTPFPPVPPAIPLNHQFEHPYMSVPHPIHGHPAHLFGRVPGPQPGPGFRPNMPPIGGPFGLGPVSPSLPPGQPGMVGPAFMGDNNGAFGVPERPKKASVPNWLREELMKKKAAVVANTSAQGHGSEDSFRASGSEDASQSFQKADMADIKSVDSHRSSDDEDEEDEVEAARTAAINQEIKRVLTEVLKKVTDDLFDEIAQEVLDEDDSITQVQKHPVNDQGRMKTFSRASPPPSQAEPSTISTRVVVSANNASVGSGDDNDNSSSSAPGGNVLGLANYASDDEDDVANQTNQVSSHVSKLEEGSMLEVSECRDDHMGQIRPGEANLTENARDEKSKNDQKSDIEDDKDNPMIKEQHQDPLVKKDTGRTSEEHGNLKAMLSPNSSKSMDKGTERNQASLKISHDDGEVDKRRSNDSKDQENRSKGITKTDTRKSAPEDRSDHREMKNRKGDNKHHDLVQHRKDGEKGREREREKDREKGGERSRGKDGEKEREREKDGEKGGEREREKDREKIKEREKDRNADRKRDKEKIYEREGRKDSERTHDKERRKDYERQKRATDNSKRNDKERGERNGSGKEKDAKDTGKRRKRSSSVSSRGRNSKVDSYDSNISSSGPEGTERTRRRRLQSSRRSSSPSPIRSRKRQVSRSRSRSRSPHVRHSHRRHSPYPSHDD
ncbi:hypothetical protein KI387_020342, partial [Taxus chinensis]